MHMSRSVSQTSLHTLEDVPMADSTETSERALRGSLSNLLFPNEPVLRKHSDVSLPRQWGGSLDLGLLPHPRGIFLPPIQRERLVDDTVLKQRDTGHHDQEIFTLSASDEGPKGTCWAVKRSSLPERNDLA